MQSCALICIALNEEDYIREWLDWHLSLGFSRVYVYDNSAHNNLSDLARPGVFVIHWPGSVQQIKAYNHFLQTFGCLYEWAAFLDVDEFLVLKKHASLPEFLEAYSHCCGLALNWRQFGTSGHDHKEPGLVRDRFVWACDHNLVKCIVRPRFVEAYNNPHYGTMKKGRTVVDTNNNRVLRDSNPGGPYDVALVHHYFTKSAEEFRQKIERGRADLHQKRGLHELENIHKKFNDYYNDDITSARVEMRSTK